MPTLDWIGKKKVVNHHLEVPFKVLNKSYMFSADGKTGDSENKIIHGDNLEALKALLPEYEGRIKCIYIDPPYNTGNEGWVYNDNVNDPRIKKWLGEVVGQEGEDLSRHDKWLCMMYPRLKLLQRLLSDDGCLVISIGFHELHNLIEVCKEIFAEKQVVTITVQTSGGKPSRGFTYTQEYLVFIVPEDFVPNISTDAMNTYSSPYHGMNLATFNQAERPNQTYPIFVNKDTGILQGVGKSLQELLDDGIYSGTKEDFEFDFNIAPEGCVAVWPITTKGDKCVWRLIPERLLQDWKNGYIKIIPQKKDKYGNQFTVQYLAEGIIDKIKTGELETYRITDDIRIPTLEVKDFKTGGLGINTIWTDKKFYTAKGTDIIAAIFGDKRVFNYSKPVDLIQTVLNRVTDKDTIILDSFAGSGTTAHAVLNMNKADGGNRKFILIEMMDYAESITAERVKRVIKGYGEDKNKVEGTGGDFSFYELGEPLLVNNLINENVETENIREYIWFTETHSKIPAENGAEAGENEYFLGKNNQAGYWFYYKKNEISTLDYDFLKTMKTKSDQYIIYADVSVIPDSFCKEHNIIFKKIPRDIQRF